MNKLSIAWIEQNRKGVILHNPYTGPMDSKNVPERTKGDIKGWSKHSRRRFRQWLISHEPISGYVVWDTTLTIPGDVIVWDDPEWREIFDRWNWALKYRDWSSVWRLEIQERGQPHWHCILLTLPAVRDIDISMLWLSVVGPNRAKVIGATKHACKTSLASGYNVAMDRYMIDHVSKKKQAQIAHNLGRHWGIIGRDKWQEIPSQTILLQSRKQAVRISRIVSKLLRRRVPDRRSFAGVPWGSPRFEVTFPPGEKARVAWLGGYCVVDWDGAGKPGIAVQRQIAQAMGKAKQNVWTLKLSRRRSNVAGQHFGLRDIDRIIESANQQMEVSP